MSQHEDGYYPIWLTNQECGDSYKKQLYVVYDNYYKETDPEKKKNCYSELQVYITIVCDVIAYRYLVKYYTNLFHKLSITIEEYMDYKVERILSTIQSKTERIDDILSYIYMSFMLSSPRLIYDYAEKVGRCKLVKELLPYFQIQRFKFFFVDRDSNREHYIFNVDNLELNENTEAIRSNLEKYSLSDYNRKQSLDLYDSSFDLIFDYIKTLDYKYENSLKYLLNIFSNWETDVESKYEIQKSKQTDVNKKDFSLLDYIKYDYECNKSLSYDEYIEVLQTLNNLLKNGKDKLRL